VADLVLLAVDVVPGDERRAGVRAGQRGEDLDGGGLAGAVRSEQTEHDAFRHRERETVEGPDPRAATGSGIGLDQIDGRQGMTSHGDSF
jgi:hypothetical protein